MDALGFTGLDEAGEHNTAVRSARVWLKMGVNTEECFDLARIDHVDVVRKSVGEATPYLRPEEEKTVRKK
jgi:hypothetical protein